MSVSVVLNLNIYSSCNVMNSNPTNKGSDVSPLETVIPVVVVCCCKTTCLLTNFCKAKYRLDNISTGFS